MLGEDLRTLRLDGDCDAPIRLRSRKAGGFSRWFSDPTAGRRDPLFSAALGLAAAVLYTVGRSPFLGQWDSFDYAKQIVTHRLSDLAFGRPVFLGLNMLVWETAKRLFRLEPTAVEHVALSVVILSGVAGVLLFRRLAYHVLSPQAARLAVPAFLLSPVYAIYSGSVMTEVPMLGVVLGSAVLLWEGNEKPGTLRLIGAGVVFGAAIGIREQALFLAPALAWILLARVSTTEVRVRALLVFGAASFAAAAAPVAWLYLDDPARFSVRTRVWLNAIPMGESHFWTNVQATTIYTLFLVPAAWIALPAALTTRRPARTGTCDVRSVEGPLVAVTLCLVIPLVALWRNADVQIHPRYVLPALPAAAMLCAAVFARRFASKRAAVVWCLLQVLVFGAAQLVMYPLREMQREKREYARQVVASVTGEALLIGGAYSPIFDYYHAIGIRPGWRILWSGWGWDPKAVQSRIDEAEASRVPVYICDGPWAWLYFEDQRLDLFFMPGLRSSEAVFPGLWVIRRSGWGKR